MLVSIRNAAVFIGSFILTSALILCIWWFNSPRKVSSSTIFAKQGFDFNALRDGTESSGPEIGEIIDLTKLTDKNSRKLVDAAKEEILMLGVMSPACRASTASRNEFRLVEEKARTMGFGYYAVLLTKIPAQENFFDFAAEMGFKSNSFQWNAEEQAPPVLSQIVTPSHILVNKQGKVIQVWLGTNKDDEIKIRMREQIKADLNLIADVIKATSIK
ncbi:MAG TPA: hypothetical protein VF648_11855 [Pyrinomonadaceae bacterium]|jgi:hypothetical protein